MASFKVQILSTIKHINGQRELVLRINGVSYTYSASSFVIDNFKKIIKKNAGRALQYLKNNSDSYQRENNVNKIVKKLLRKDKYENTAPIINSNSGCSRSNNKDNK